MNLDEIMSGILFFPSMNREEIWLALEEYSYLRNNHVKGQCAVAAPKLN